jgi:hypothetical protein
VAALPPVPTEDAFATVCRDEGDARFLARTLTAYGYSRDQLGPELRRRFLAWGILHRYSHLAGWMRRLPEPARPTLQALADRWFATELSRCATPAERLGVGPARAGTQARSGHFFGAERAGSVVTAPAGRRRCYRPAIRAA